MEIPIPVQTVAAYSIILTYVVDLLSKIPKIGSIVTGWGKQIVAVGVGVAYCIATDYSVIEDGTNGKVITGILLAALSGTIIARGAEWLKAKKDLAIAEYNGGK